MGHACATGAACTFGSIADRHWDNVVWTTCPVCAWRADPLVQYVERLRRLARIAPLSGWPQRYAAQVILVWEEINAAVAEHDAYKAEMGG